MTVVLGYIEEYPVVYNTDEDSVFCKNMSVPAAVMIRAWKSDIDREKINSKLLMHKKEGFTVLGCFTVTLEKSQLLINKLKRVHYANRRNG